MNCPWGQKALSGYLGDDRDVWAQHDACALVAGAGEKLPLLVDQGTADDFLDKELKPQLLEKACKNTNHPLTLRMQPGYDHSYFFISTFMKDHLDWHDKAFRI